MAKRHALPADLTVASPAARGPDLTHDFPTDASVQHRAGDVRPFNSPTPPTSTAASDFSSEFPSEEDALFSGLADAPTAVALVTRPPRMRAGWQNRAAWWIAAACAVLAIVEAGIITGRIPLRLGNGFGPAGPDARQSAPAVSAGTAPRVPPSPLNPTALGQLEVTSDPPGARVTVDDRIRGNAPVTVSVSPGPHTVVVSDGTTTSRKTVEIVSGGTATF